MESHSQRKSIFPVERQFTFCRIKFMSIWVEFLKPSVNKERNHRLNNETLYCMNLLLSSNLIFYKYIYTKTNHPKTLIQAIKIEFNEP